MKSQAPLATQEWLKTAHRCEVCWPLKDAVKLYGEPKGYDRGEVDWKERSVPPYPMTPEQKATRVTPSQPELKAAKVVERVEPGVEVDVEALLKRTKAGKINTQSTVGKVVALAMTKGVELKAGRSAKVEWLQGAHHGLRFSVSGTTVLVNGALVAKEELLRRLEEIGVT